MEVRMHEQLKVSSGLSLEIIESGPRGSMTVISRNGQERGILFETLARMARGGEISTEEKYIQMLEGRGFWMFIRDGRREFVEQKTNEKLTIAAGVPQLFIALEDTVFLRWFETGGSGKDKNVYYPELRQYVDSPEKIRTLIEEYEKDRRRVDVSAARRSDR